MTDFDVIPEASYRGILFPVESADVDGGTDFVEHTAYRRRGADMEPAGLKAYKGSLTIPLLNTGPLVQRYGTLWPDLRADLVQMFSDNPIGTLIHPTWGSLEVAILSWSTKDSPDLRNGQRLTLPRFATGRGSLSSGRSTTPRSPRSSPSTAPSRRTRRPRCRASRRPRTRSPLARPGMCRSRRRSSAQ